MKVKAPTQEEMVSGGNWLTEPGKFHANIINVLAGCKQNGDPADCDTIELEIMAGCDENGKPLDCFGKTVSLTFFAPDPSADEKAQLRTEKLNTALLIATQLLTPTQLGQEIEVDVTQAVGRHINVHLENSMKKNQQTGELEKTKFFRVVWQDIFHIDDPDAASYPKNVDALKYIDPKFRITKPGEYFAYKMKRAAAAKSATAGSSTQAQSKPKSAALDF